MKYFTLIFPFLFCAEISFGQAGKLDSSFANVGKQTADFKRGADFCRTLLIRPNGKILLIGNSETDSCTYLIAAQYDQSGVADSSFGINGKAFINITICREDCYAAALQPDGKFIIACTEIENYGSHALLFRCDSNGSLDPSFSQMGIASSTLSNGTCIAFSSGKIYLGGYPSGTQGLFAIERYNLNGLPDSSFGLDGEVSTAFGIYNSFGTCIAIQADGKILLGGYVYNFSNADFAIARYNLNGTLDTSFGNYGKCIIDIVENDACQSIGIQSDGRIVMLGTSSNTFHYNFELARINPNGTIDSSFNNDGKVFTPIDFQDDEACSVALQRDNKILACGFSRSLQTQLDKLLLLRYNNDGTLDNSFAADGIIDTTFNSLEEGAFSVAIQADGKILTGGWSANASNDDDFAVERFISGLMVGVINLSKPTHSIFIYPNPIHQTETLQYSLIQDENLSINLYDVSGRLVQTFLKNQRRMEGNHSEQLNFHPSLAAGNYVLMISSGESAFSINLTKQ